jgi:hypothetical protein
MNSADVALLLLLLGLGTAGLCSSSCGSSAASYTAADLKGDQHDEALAKGCQALCLSDAGCTPTQAAACFDAIICNRSGSLHRHGAPDMTDGGAGCVPQ